MRRQVCTGCTVSKVETDFHWLNKSLNKRDPRCKTCRSATAKQRYARKRDHILSLNTVWREDNREHHRELVHTWQKANPDREIEKVNRRRARKRGLATDNSTRQDVWVASSGECHLCKRSWKLDERWEIDHLIPISLDGDDTLGNKAVACGHCNRRKGNRLVESGSYA